VSRIKHHWRKFICWLRGHKWKQFEQDLGCVAFECVVDSRRWKNNVFAAAPGSIADDFEKVRHYTSTPQTRLLKKHETCMRCYQHRTS